MTDAKFTITDPQQAQTVLGWVKAGRGVKLFKSHDIGAGRSDLLCPGDMACPHWAYPESAAIELNEIEVCDRTPMLPPPEWTGECQICRGVGHRTYAEIAEIRSESVDECRARLTSQHQWAALQRDNDSFTCNTCDGTGHERFVMYIRVKRQYWGAITPIKLGVPHKVSKVISKLAEHFNIDRSLIKWDFDVVDNGTGRVFFFTEKSIRFDEYMKQHQ